jgi:hypothetical protein
LFKGKTKWARGADRNSSPPRASAASQSAELAKNADGSVDLYFGPKAPAGKESNWVPTRPDGEIRTAFPAVCATKPLFDKTWKLPDVERVPGQ